MPLNRGTISLEQIDKLDQSIFLDLLNFDNAVLNAEQGDGIALPKFQSTSDIPTNLPEGTIVFILDENKVYFWDGSSPVQLNTSSSQYTDEQAQDAVASLLAGNTNIGLVYDDANNELTISVNGGPGSGLDADTVDGVEASNLGSDRSKIEQTIKFGAEGSRTQSNTYVTITHSDIAIDFSNYRDDNGNLEIRLVGHLSIGDFGDTNTAFARMYRQNAGTAVAGTEISHTTSDENQAAWGFANSGWVDFSNESGRESYQIQLRTSDTSEAPEAVYNSMILQIKT